MGRTLTLNENLIQAICEDIRAGQRPEVAAARHGVSRARFYAWRRSGREGGGEIYERFEEQVGLAVDCAEGQLLESVLTGDASDYSFGPAKASLEVLKRRWSDHYSEKVKVSVEREIDKVLDVVARVCSTEDFERILAELAAGDSGEETGEAQV